MNKTEKQLIKSCVRGDKAAHYEFVKRYSGMLLTVCRRYTSDSNLAKDILQESLIKIFANLDSYKELGSFEAWMRKITGRCALGYLSLKSNRQHAKNLELQEDSKRAPEETLSALGCEEIIKLIQELPVGFRTVFNLFSIEGYSHKEISVMLQITESASRSQLSRARAMLQRKIEELNTIKYPST